MGLFGQAYLLAFGAVVFASIAGVL